MKRKKPSLLSVLVFTSIFLSSPAYIDFQELIEAHFLSARGRYEDRDVEDFSVDKQLNFKIESSSFSTFSRPGNNLFDSLSGLSFLPIPSSDQKPGTLRCYLFLIFTLVIRGRLPDLFIYRAAGTVANAVGEKMKINPWSQGIS